MTLVHSNLFDDFLLSLDDPMPPMPNEFHDSITTPVLVTELSDRREASQLADKIQQYDLTVNIYDIRLVPSDASSGTPSSTLNNSTRSTTPTTNNHRNLNSSTIAGTLTKVNFQLKIEIGDQKAKTSRKSVKLNKNLQEETTITFNETFPFHFNTILSQFLDHSIELRLISSGRSIKGTKVLGKVDFDVASLYNESGMSIRGHSLALFSEQSSELIGYIKCDLIIDLSNAQRKESLLPVIRPVTPLSRLTPIESRTKNMEIQVNIYSGEMPSIKTRTKDKLVSRIRSRKAAGLCVTVSLGDLEGSTSANKRFTSPVWNETLVFNTSLNIDKPPPMVFKVHDKSTGSGNFKPLTKSLDLAKLYLPGQSSGPIYGPSYMVVKEVPKDHVFNETCLSGRLLISIRSTLLDGDERSHKESNPSITDKSNVSFDSKSSRQTVNGSSAGHDAGESIELNPVENQENNSSFLNQSDRLIQHSVSCSQNDAPFDLDYPREDEFTFLGVLYSSNLIPKKLENRKLSYEVDLSGASLHERCGSPSILDLTLGSIIDATLGNGDEKILDDRSTALNRSTPIKGYTDQEHAKLTETPSILTTASKSSEKSDQGSVSGDATSKSDTLRSNPGVPEKPSLTVPLKPVTTSGDPNHLHLPLERSKPLLGIEQTMVDTRHRSFVANMIRQIRSELEIGLTDVREMALIEHQDTCRRFRGVLEDLMVHCNRFLALTIMPTKYPKNELDSLFTRYRQLELIKLSADVKNTLVTLNESNLSECLSTVTGYLGRIEDLLADPQDGFSDIIIYLLADGKRIGYCRIPVSEVIFSRLENEKGPACGKVSTYYIKSIKNPELILNQISLYTWLGLKRHKRHSTSGLVPGYEESLQLVFFQSLDGSLPPYLNYPEQ